MRSAVLLSLVHADEVLRDVALLPWLYGPRAKREIAQVKKTREARQPVRTVLLLMMMLRIVRMLLE